MPKRAIACLAVISILSGCSLKEESSEEMYTAFINGEVEVDISNVYQLNTDFKISEIASKDDYSLDELDELICDNIPFYDKSAKTDIDYEIIDCGEDEQNELLVKMSMNGAIQNGYCTYLVIKNIDDNLQLKFVCTGDEKDSVSIDESGYIAQGGSAGASQYNSSYGYLDSDVRWTQLYEEYYFLDMITFSDYLNDKGFNVDLSGKEWAQLQAEVYFIDDEEYILYSKVDENGVWDESIYDSNNEYKKYFESRGIKTYSKDEIDELVQE